MTVNMNWGDDGTDVLDEAMTRQWYRDRLHWQSRYCGVPTVKIPTDMWVLQEIIWETKPDLIIETGTFLGGSALYMAHCLQALGKGRVVTIDPERWEDRDGYPMRPRHSRITYLTGSSLEAGVQHDLAMFCKPGPPLTGPMQSAPRIMVVLDSQHEREHVLAELRYYGALVTPGCYMIVEDTVINGHPVDAAEGAKTPEEAKELDLIVADGGPWEAVSQYLLQDGQHDRWEVDRTRQKFGVTFNPDGFLRRTEQV